MLVKVKSLKNKGKQVLNKDEEISEIEELIENLQSNETNTRKEVTEFAQDFLIDNTQDDMLIKLTEIKSNFIKYNDLMNSTNIIFEKQNEILKKLKELEESIKGYLLRYFNDLSNQYVTYAQEIKMKKMDFQRQRQDYEMKLKTKEENEKINKIKELQEIKENNTENIDKTNEKKFLTRIKLAERSMLFTTLLPSITTDGIQAKLESNKTSCDACAAASLPDAIAILQSASFSARTSFTPSPVIATVFPASLSA